MKIITPLLVASIITAYGITNVKVYNGALTLIEAYTSAMHQAAVDARRMQLCASSPPPCAPPVAQAQSPQ